MEDDVVQALTDVVLELSRVRSLVEEVLRRIPEPLCRACGLAGGFHTGQFGADHEFTP